MNFKERISESPYLLFHDIETTGFDHWRCTLLVWAGIVTDKDLNILDRTVIKIKPDPAERWDSGAEKIHKISEWEASMFQERRKGFISILNFLKPFLSTCPLTTIEHSKNAFDIKGVHTLAEKEDAIFSIRKVMQRSFQISTIDMAKAAGHTDNKLNTWASRIGFKLDHHNAESDTECTLELFKHLRGVIDEI